MKVLESRVRMTKSGRMGMNRRVWVERGLDGGGSRGSS